jgi:uncharacterized membrane protein required for colicin V production
MACDALLSVLALPAVGSLLVHVMAAAIWPAVGVGVLPRALGLVLGLICLASQLLQVFLMVARPHAAAPYRDYLWSTNYAAAPSLLPVAGALVQVPGWLSPYKNALVLGAVQGLVDAKVSTAAAW